MEKRRKAFRRTLEKIKKLEGGKVLFGTDYAQTLARTSVAPEVMKTTYGLSCIRRRNADGRHYFISALTDWDTEAWVPLAVPARSAMLYNPMDGTSGKAALRQRDGKTEVLLQLASGQSVILKTFAEADVQAEAWNYYTPLSKEFARQQVKGPYSAVKAGRTSGNGSPACLTLDGTWNFRFVESAPAVSGVPGKVSLGSWTDLPFEGAGTAMGTACYATTFRIDNPSSVGEWMLSLGDVRESARVRINGQEVATLWAVPFRCLIGRYLRPGQNTLEVEVTNLPANRIADMDRRGVKWRIFKDINIAALGYKKGTYAGWQPVPGGLLGPVTVVPMAKIKE